MLFNLNIFAAVVATFSAISSTNARVEDVWLIDSVYKVIPQVRLDPIVSPNAIASHAHRVFGGSGFAAGYNHADYKGASCSSIGVQADKSNYWFPQLYWIDKTSGSTKYIAINGTQRIYYNMARDADNVPNLAFPPGLRMLIGDPAAKTTQDNTSSTYVCQVSDDMSKNLASNSFNYGRDCPKGLKMSVNFPTCWDGINLWKADRSHMVYSAPGRSFGGACPLSHPFRVPGIIFEITYFPKDLPGVAGKAMAGNLIWSNGDTTGYGLHGDFVNGWDVDVLTKALNDNRCVGEGLPGSTAKPPMTWQACPPLAASYDDAKAKSCKITNYPKEQNSQEDWVAIPSLAGCNLPWGNTPTKPTCGSTFTPDVTPFKKTDGSLTAVAPYKKDNSLPTSGGWRAQYCVYGDRGLFANEISYNDASQSTTRCTLNCQASGYRWAGMTPDAKCMCGTSVNMSLGSTPNACTSKCKGDSSQFCGAPAYSSIWYAGPSVSLPSGPGTRGCYVPPYDATTGFKGAVLKTLKSDSMTSALCKTTCAGYKWAATENANSCSCGNDWKIGQGHFAMANQKVCTTPCNGNANEICGQIGTSNYMVYVLSGTGTSNLVATQKTASSGASIGKVFAVSGGITSHKFAADTDENVDYSIDVPYVNATETLSVVEAMASAVETASVTAKLKSCHRKPKNQHKTTQKSRRSRRNEQQ